jgi:dolichol-phosphate mannosyltransferase
MLLTLFISGTLRCVMSRIANGIRRRWLGDGVSDSGCALKVFRRQVLDSFLPIRSLYSFIPAFAVSAGFRVREYPVRHRARRAGEAKYDLRVMLWRPFVDMMAIGWIMHRRVPLVEAQEIVPDTKSEDR